MTCSTRVGLDVGGTLIKIAYYNNEKLELLKFPAVHMDAAAEWIQLHCAHAEIHMTGGRAEMFQKLIPHSVLIMNEFDATCRGVLHLLSESGQSVDSFILTNVGTGTSIHYVSGKVQTRVGGTGVGGGTMMGLSTLLAGISRFEDIVRLAPEGDRGNIDLKVSHIYEGSEPPIPGDLTASNFGRVVQVPTAERTAADYVASVIGLIGETVTTASIFAAAQYSVSNVIYIGSSFVDNAMLQEVVIDYTKLRGAQPLILTNGEFSGAIGALLAFN
ncbi:type II pantothenate kinase [Paenibacillus xerothermodurans]|uniref:Type II pantothenate kinase n=1 Tax=Paenibacillus xerothermodurans TaxID=1977292 RepID=A0A2W1P4L4_PAEXE|nr:type II pantothenate kinase [Paenibacillus xerothermodurans]PZE22088.1 type II pantothenate kinase [Paenibacillus xerothermodurans]